MKNRNTIVLAVLALVATLLPATVGAAASHDVFFSEIHYDNTGTDTGEAIEVTAPAGMDMSGWSIVLYNGSPSLRSPYNTTNLAGVVPAGGAFTVNYGTNGIQNGAPDGMALVDSEDNVVEFLSYEGTFTAASGPAEGLTSTDIGVAESSSTAIGDSLQKEGETWVGPQTSNFAPELEPLPPTPLLIHDIQGDGFSSPVAGEFVSIEGIVNAVFQDDPVKGQQLGGFFVQEEGSDWDDSDATSEGIFVFAPFEDVEVGQVVEVVGTVAEFDQLTEITNVEDVTVTGSATVTPIDFTLPATDADREAVEGMLISLTQDLHIVEFFDYDRTNEVVLATDRQFQGTHVFPPGDDAVELAETNALNQIRIDDARTSQNPEWNQHPDGSEYTEDNSFRGGDLLLGMTGVMHEGTSHFFDNFPTYMVQPTGPATHTETNPRPTAPDDVGGDIKVASFNVLNFFTHLDDGSNDICGPTGNLECRGADSSFELTRQLDKLVAGIIALDADIVGIQEIENDIRGDDPVFPNRAHDPVLTLVETLNDVEGAGTWAWVGEANHYNDYPVRNDIIYKPDSVELVGDPVALADEAFDQKRPGDIAPVGRPPLAQTFRQNGPGSKQPFTVVVNHFKSKGSSCASIGDPFDPGGQGNCNLTRVAQSEALLDFVDELAEDSSGVLVIGDLNSYAMEDPITTLEDAGLTDLVEEFVGPDAYSFVFDGQLGYLDIALATRSMLNWVTGTTVFHINADEPDIIDFDASFKSDTQIGFYEPTIYRASDHDPVIVGLEFGGPGR